MDRNHGFGTPLQIPDQETALPPTVLRELCRALRTMRFGAIELVIQDGRVVQLERRQKVRFDSEVTQHRRQQDPAEAPRPVAAARGLTGPPEVRPSSIKGDIECARSGIGQAGSS
jgi:hypothetical protein